KTGVEKAAESVLGDEAEALRRARAELDALTEQLRREIAQARPDLAQTDAESPRGAGVRPLPPDRTPADVPADNTPASPGGADERAGKPDAADKKQSGKQPGT